MPPNYIPNMNPQTCTCTPPVPAGLLARNNYSAKIMKYFMLTGMGAGTAMGMFYGGAEAAHIGMAGLALGTGEA